MYQVCLKDGLHAHYSTLRENGGHSTLATILWDKGLYLESCSGLTDGETLVLSLALPGLGIPVLIHGQVARIESNGDGAWIHFSHRDVDDYPRYKRYLTDAYWGSAA
ncbi:MAG: hypothetical protein HYU64_07395 [Armatimonadetes bacterium]|nr:hypothetical protein [Armatimonadota bacterium]